MNAEPRTALERLIAALERHFEAAATGRGDEDPAYLAAYRQLIEAFEAYDDALYDAYGIDAAFLVYDDDEDDLVDEEEGDDPAEPEEF
ncbi:MAG: hypothetical protein LBU05_05920 [Bifidobacteriaceae bacterium]|jgi:hypothetical protein|nr:hypothetical protein [Bifidobacteriaceae bacterium]